MANPALAHALAHALTAAAHGFRVIPLTRAKLPAVRSPHHHDPAPLPCHGECGRLGHGVHDASADPEAIRALFAAAPWATGYGIACGCAPHHLIGVDLDLRDGRAGAPQGAGEAGGTTSRAGQTGEPGGARQTRQDGQAGEPGKPGASGKAGAIAEAGTSAGTGTSAKTGASGKAGTDGPAALARLAREHAFAIPRTVTVLTPSGGRHLWLCGPPGLTVPNSAGRLAPGIDIRGLGGYLVGPGSYSSHGSYRLAPGSPDWAPAPAPPALLRLLTPPRPSPRPYPPSPRPRTAALAGLVRFVRASREGQRNVRLFWAACRAYETGAGPELAPALIEAALDTGLPPHEARATVASAARSAARHLQPPEAWA
ncbi:bifunctional DNA primase/polymerase [Streptomyces luomodiensis]|uniref:Bifunctional DNA primase/polymerase n=1 Tax=Streptomyces luomodiensis TaxID=3026192 RepID=A0ABY9UYU7_9ACTN|nr:bifunctional DNA primase/polymerase [Streptomyces sp. SCA4-21]WNE97591.1 bifunctional DNA primase/polymerase [Streptomyces sp. SCA4-21]